jgi:4-alpha-glucanotransferase
MENPVLKFTIGDIKEGNYICSDEINSGNININILEKKNSKTYTDNISNSGAKVKTNNTVKTKHPTSSKSQKIAEKNITSSTKKIGRQSKQMVGQNLTIDILKITFQLKYTTHYGQTIFVTGNHPLLGNNDIEKALPMQYFNHEHWQITLNLNKKDCVNEIVTYNYFLKEADGSISFDWGNDKYFNLLNCANQLLLVDAWNSASFIENTFYTVPFEKVLLKYHNSVLKTKTSKKITHTFNAKAPLLLQDQTLCIIGSSKVLGNWNTEKVVVMQRKVGEVYYSVDLDFSKEQFPIAYKYGVYDVIEKKFIQFETGENRFLNDSTTLQKHTIINDAFAVLPNTTWKGAGVAIPVFSLRSQSSFGIGEFTDLKLLVDWSKNVGLKMIQILPINDTSATMTNADSYPYAAISAFALHPIYINLLNVINPKHKNLINEIEVQRAKLNDYIELNYEQVIQAKLNYLNKIYSLQKTETFNSKSYQNYFTKNKSWLMPYAVFCFLRDEYGTAHFQDWPHHRIYNQAEVDKLLIDNSDQIGFHYFVQYHLHLQLKDATEYAHSNGIVLKGDIAIGIYRYGTDAWQQTELFNLELQAGAPPDDFAVKGQNWGFPTYNWQRMKQDGFAWWKQRFEQMSDYFDAFRIDHILGFFRIWSIPTHAVEGIMGYFVPCIPIHINEFSENGVEFDINRHTKPFISEKILWEIFGYDNELVKQTFLHYDGFEHYTLKKEFSTQVQVEKYFDFLESSDHNNKLRQGIFDLISNVILFEVEQSHGTEFHFRFGMEQTSSFKYLNEDQKQKLNRLYVDYFFRRQDDFWKKEALQKLPSLKRVTNMLVCGEDLGMVPNCVPDVMRQLGLLSLEIQRMPKDANKQFFNPKDAPYLSVVTPSTHDMSTIRGWWEEDKNITQQFYNNELGYWGSAPLYCEPWINKAIVTQHLASPAMWSIFQLQDLLGIDADIRKENPNEERINIPADAKHYWSYRMHLTLENLLQQSDYNDELNKLIITNGR